nr:MAG TPA: hypothetical protein [Caudoviricetes sp.]
MAVTKTTKGYYLAKYNDLSVAELTEDVSTAEWHSLKDELLLGFTWTTEKSDDSFSPAASNNDVTVRVGYNDKIDAKCKRFVGGEGQKLLLKKDRGLLTEAQCLVKAELSDGTSLVMTANVDVTNRGTDENGNTVAAFEVSFTNAQGEPTYTETK